MLSSRILEPPNGGIEGTAPITCLATLRIASQRILVAGDTFGGLRFWKANRSGDTVQFVHAGLLQLSPGDSGDGHLAPSSSSCTVVCMEALSGGRLAVSTD